MKNLLFASVISLLLISCGENEKKEDDASKKITAMNALYEKNLAVLQSGFAAFEKKDISSFAANVSDNVMWNGASYGDTVHTKTQWLQGLKYYIDNWDSLQFNHAFYLPGIDSATRELDGSVRCYGRWDAVHKSGVKTHVKYYATFDFNGDNKISSASEFFDVGGLMNAVTPKKK
jgi:hypothetical protein